MTDTHVHLDEVEDVASLLVEAEEAGVTRVVAMGVDLVSSRRAVELAARHPQVRAAIGHHPMSDHDPDLAAFSKLAGDGRVVAVGEVGLDASGAGGVPPERQERWFHAMCEMADRAGLPVSVHTRDAAARTHAVLASHPGLRGVMHYFDLDWAWARRFLELGFHISFSGLVTRPSREALREVARRCPADRLLLETDAPHGVPHGRTAPNRPAWMVDTARVVADLRGVTLADLAAGELANAERLFGGRGRRPSP
ncbi:MAG: TatD family hydrolase [Candidatus Dormibacteraceae bacterium]